MPREILLKAQQLKERVFVEDGKVIVPFSQAALAFGVSINKLQDLAGEHKALVIFPREDDMVEVSLKSSVADWRKDLWEGMLESLERGRSDNSKAKDEYVKFYRTLQKEIVGLSSEEKAIRQLGLCVLWEMIGPANRREMEDISPQAVLAAVGIVGSEE